MVEHKAISLTDIEVPERLRAVEEDQALAISASIVEHGLINPITVRVSPPNKKSRRPFILIAGAHRLRAMELLDETEIDAVVIKADGDEAQLVEITENLIRNDLSVMDRAIFISSYRDVWERKYGKIQRGGDQRAKRQLVALLAAEAEAGFSAYVAERLGCSTKKIERLNTIAQGLHVSLRAALRGTPIADNQSLLLQLAKLPTDKQRELTKALKLTGGDLQKAQATIDDQEPVRPSDENKLVSRLLSTWGRLDLQERRRFVTDELPEDDQRAVYETLKAKFEGENA